MQYHLLIITIFLSINAFPILGQHEQDILALIEKYELTSDENIRYDLYQEIMEKNAMLSLEEANTMYKNSIQLSSNQQNSNPLPLMLAVMADTYYYHDHLDSSFYYYIREAHAGLRANDLLATCFGYGNAAYVLEQRGKFGEANKLRRTSLNHALDYGNKKNLADAFYNLANNFYNSGKIDSASVYLKKTIALDRESGNIQGMVHNLHFLIQLNLKSNKVTEVVEYCEQCVQMAKEINYSRGLSTCYALQAELNLNLNQNVLASIAIEKAIEIDQQRKDLTRMGKLFHLSAKIQEKLDLSNAENLYKESIQYSESNKDINEQGFALIHLAEFYLSQGDFEKSNKQLEKVQLLINLGNNTSLEESYLDLNINLAKSQNNWKKVTFFSEAKNQLLSDFNRELIANQASNIGQSFEIFEIERQKEKILLEKEMDQLKAQRKTNLFIGIGGLLLLTTLLAYFAFQNQKNKSLAFRKKAQEEKLRLNNLVLEKELDALRSQMNPHFLFNSLNSINGYIMYEKPQLASKYLTKFSKLMRTILNNSKSKFIRISDEIEAIHLYMEMEALRFPDQFDFELCIDEKIIQENVWVPSMLIQPYLENSVKHGMKNIGHKGIITLTIRMKAKDKLEIVIQDNGIGRKASALQKKQGEIDQKSLGIKITADRAGLLNDIYNAEMLIEYFDLENPTGTKVQITFKPQINEEKEWKEFAQLS